MIQELFPRVSCVGTLDISDNGEQWLFFLTAVGTGYPCNYDFFLNIIFLDE